MPANKNEKSKRNQTLNKSDVTNRDESGQFKNRDKKDGGRAREFLSDMMDSKTFDR